jgi:hypothetical protein
MMLTLKYACGTILRQELFCAGAKTIATLMASRTLLPLLCTKPLLVYDGMPWCVASVPTMTLYMWPLRWITVSLEEPLCAVANYLQWPIAPIDMGLFPV